MQAKEGFMAQAETHELQVLNKGIHCPGCETTIQRMLARVPGIESVKADHKTQRVRLTLDGEKVSVQEIRDQMEQLGFPTAP